MRGWREYLPIVRQRVRPLQFNSLFLFVTSRCNSKCRTCFYWDKLNSADDLSFAEICWLSETAPPFQKLWISGGEPFLREELAEIVRMFRIRNGVSNVNLPTNGLLAERIFRDVGRMLAENPELTIDLNFSLDGLANTHDAIRGVLNNFERSLNALKEVRRRFRAVRRLRVNVVSVITRENHAEILELGWKLLRESPADGHYFEVIRGQAPDASLKEIAVDGLARLHERLMRLHAGYARRLFGRLPALVRHVATAYYLGNLQLHYDLHQKCHMGPSPWPMRCTAGVSTLVVDHNGDFRSCELRQPIGNLRQFSFDVSAALASEAMRKEVDAIPRDNCWCTHSCFIQDSSKFSPRVQLFEIPYAYLRQLVLQGRWWREAEVRQYKSLEAA